MNIIVILDLWGIKIDLKYCHGNVSTFQGFTNEYIYIHIFFFHYDVSLTNRKVLKTEKNNSCKLKGFVSIVCW